MLLRSRFCWIALAGAVHCAALCSAASTRQRPNILLVLADDMGFSDIGCYGSEIETPHLDRLAGGGLRFSQFYNAARCCPSRASLMTGLYPHQAGVGHMLLETGLAGYSGGLREDCVTIPELLRSAGYKSYMCGKWHLGWKDRDSPTARGFDRFYGTRGYVDSYFTVVPRTEVYLDDEMVIAAGQKPTNGLHHDREWYTTDVYTDYAIHFLEEHHEAASSVANGKSAAEGELSRQSATPFFLYLAYNAPHFPLHAKPEDLAKYRGRYRQGWDAVRAQRHDRMQQLGLISTPLAPSEPDAPDWDSLSAEERDELDLKMACYAAIIDRLDQNIGRLVHFLEERGLLENTVIIFLSDNGATHVGGLFGLGKQTNASNYQEWARKGGWTSSLGQGWANVANTPFRQYKQHAHEGGTASPFIVHWPAGLATKPGTVIPQVAHLIDLYPTLADIAGVPLAGNNEDLKSPPAEGISLAPALRGAPAVPRRLFWEHEGNRAVRHGTFKLVALADQPWELYDLADDRTEMKDLAAQEPSRVEELEQLWEAWAKRSNVLPWSEVSKRLRERRQQARRRSLNVPQMN